MTSREIAARLGLRRVRPAEWRGTCPACGYVAACVLSEGRDGAPLLWCACCRDRKAMGAVLRGEGYQHPAQRDRIPARSSGQREAWARAMWQRGQAAAGTVVDRYLAARGLAPVTGGALRYLPADRHTESGHVGPVMLAAACDVAGTIRATHRTWLQPDGAGKASVDPPRKTLGHPLGCAVRLMPAIDEVVLAEGLETALSASVLFGLPAWACLSAGGLEAVRLPETIRDVVIAADRDVHGEGERAAETLAMRLAREGRAVRIALPNTPGTDFNDFLIERSKRHV
ncbi:DUF7146 domain-containing protein [Elioraea rosea]|uniref:DUF7146 domain-containing protein n=1 Tax=Elioraea rosea TaxID=2492390 RepID=UPI0011843FB9|nr:toprim domain-containing protein [Elioraea rosea]